MNTVKSRKWVYFILLAGVILTVFLLGGATKSGQRIDAEECYRLNAESLVYLRSYYESGSLKTTGSGFIVSKDGAVVTAAHVIKGGSRLTAILPDGQELALTTVYSDDETDLAVLRLPAGKYKAVQLADKAPSPGATVRAMGYPIKGTGVITEGVVAAQSAEVSRKMRMMVTCDIVNGMSGGPILDAAGRVVGVVSGSVVTMDGIHLSTLSDALYQTVAEYVTGKTNAKVTGGAK